MIYTALLTEDTDEKEISKQTSKVSDGSHEAYAWLKIWIFIPALNCTRDRGLAEMNGFQTAGTAKNAQSTILSPFTVDVNNHSAL